MMLGLIGALIAALAYGSATIIQAIGVRRMSAAPPHAPLLTRARLGWLYAVGIGLDGLGFLASAGALRSLPLFLVQSVIASSVAVTAVLAVVVLDAHLSGREIGALGAVAVGLVMLAVTAHEGPAKGTPSWLGPALLAAAVVGIGLGLVGRRLGSAPLLALAAGIGFSGVGIGARILPWHGSIVDVLDEPALWAILVHAALATIAYGYALDAGTATAVAAISFSVETLLPSAVGLAWLGDAVRPHTGPLAVAGFAVTLAGCLVLAGRSEQEPDEQEAADENA